MLNKHQAVAAGLIANGIPASVEHPGCVRIEVDAHISVWTGLHSWAYGSIYRLNGDAEEAVEGADDVAQVRWDVDRAWGVDAIVAAWTRWVEQRRTGDT